ncbi:MAG: RNA 2',3'-cyclic phosphodiesterase [Planctomycetota bacterium]
MPQQVRAFISAPISDEVRAAITRVQTMLINSSGPRSMSGLSLVAPENYHITLKFLGDTEVEEIPRITAVMREITAAITPFDVAVAGVGGLPRIEKPRVVYIGVRDDSGYLAEIAEGLNTRFPEHKQDHKRFVAHITFMRVTRPEAWHWAASRLDGWWAAEFGRDRVTGIELMQSVLRPDGPEYSLLERVSF